MKQLHETKLIYIDHKVSHVQFSDEMRKNLYWTRYGWFEADQEDTFCCFSMMSTQQTVTPLIMKFQNVRGRMPKDDEASRNVINRAKLEAWENANQVEITRKLHLINETHWSLKNFWLKFHLLSIFFLFSNRKHFLMEKNSKNSLSTVLSRLLLSSFKTLKINLFSLRLSFFVFFEEFEAQSRKILNLGIARCGLRSITMIFHKSAHFFLLFFMIESRFPSLTSLKVHLLIN